MNSTKSSNIEGQYMHPVIDRSTENSDPWQRNYFQPPPFKTLVPRLAPLIDLRPIISEPGYDANNLLKSHGFGVVKHESKFLQMLDRDDIEQCVTQMYHPEIRDLALKITGAKKVFILASVLRRGKPTPEEYKLPVKVSSVSSATSRDTGKGGSNDNAARDGKSSNRPLEKPAVEKIPTVAEAAPVRVPHLDFTPLGARQTIRFQDQEIYDVAMKRGVIVAEDGICENQPFQALVKEADALIAENYNLNGELGPRYAAYSIWRPISTVGRDPITLAPRREIPTASRSMIYWPYENKIPGQANLGGDFLKQYAMLGISGEDIDTTNVHNNGSDVDPLEWYYVSAQEPDEVLFIKLFDSASLGSSAQHAGAPWHASPEIGDIEGAQVRESIEIRVLVFW